MRYTIVHCIYGACAEMEPGQDFWPVTRPDPIAFDPVTRPDPVSSINDVKSRNVVTSHGQSARK